MSVRHKKLLSFGFLVAFVILLVTLLWFVSPSTIVESIGVRNGYLVALVVAFFGGFSAGGSFAFISVLLALAAGGLNPILLGLISGASLALGDFIIFYTGSKGRELVRGKWKEKINEFASMFQQSHRLQNSIPLFAYFYMSFAPFPNDILLLFLAAVKYPMRKIVPVIVLADITFASLVAFLGAEVLAG